MNEEGKAAPPAVHEEPKAAPPAVHVVDRRREKKGRKKKRRKVSRELRDLEQMERHLSRAAEHTAQAVADGVKTYSKRRRRSAEQKRDGALRDMPLNTGHGLAQTLRGLSEVPVDLARAMSTRSIRRVFYGATRMLFYPLRRA